MKNKEKLFSIIVPAYNSESFIERCIESVLRQTYSNFELILIDDGSKDKTLQICRLYSECDDRVSVIHKENGGHTSARNAGLKEASGKYILFLDSDDWIASDVLEICAIEIEKNLPDVLIYQIYNTWTKKVFVNNIPFGFYERKINYSDIMNSLIMDQNGQAAFIKGLIGKVFKKDIIMNNQLTVPYELRIAEDAAAFVGAIIDSSSISVISNATYFYYVRDGSVSHSADKDAFFRLPFMFEYYKNKLQNCSYDFTLQFDRYIVAQIYTAVLLVIRSGMKSKKINLELEKLLKNSMVSSALNKAKFSRKGYKFLIKQYIIRHRLWRLAMLIDR